MNYFFAATFLHKLSLRFFVFNLFTCIRKPTPTPSSLCAIVNDNIHVYASNNSTACITAQYNFDKMSVSAPSLRIILPICPTHLPRLTDVS